MLKRSSGCVPGFRSLHRRTGREQRVNETVPQEARREGANAKARRTRREDWVAYLRAMLRVRAPISWMPRVPPPLRDLAGRRRHPPHIQLIGAPGGNAGEQ